MVKAEGCDTGIMHGSTFDPGPVHNFLPCVIEAFPFAEQDQLGRFQPAVDLLESIGQRRRRIVNAGMRDYRQKLVQAGPRDRPL